MEPIVSPWFIYLLSLVNTLIVIYAVTATCCFAALLVYYITLACMQGEYDKSERERWLIGWKKAKRYVWILFVISLVSSMLIPSKNTIIAMYVADNITPNNVEKALDVGKDFKEEIKKDIFELIEAIQKDETKSNE